MVVVVANDLPDRVRGRMKLWFVEPRPNVFVSGITDHVALKVTEYLMDNCPDDSGVIIFRSLPEPPGYRVHVIGTPDKKIVKRLGLQLVVEKELALVEESKP